MNNDNIGLRVFLGALIFSMIYGFYTIGSFLFGGGPTMICKDNKVYLREMGHDIYHEASNREPCFLQKELQ